jgi:hypothetical protein
MREKLAERDKLVDELERRLRKEKAKAAELKKWVKYSDDGTEVMFHLMSEVAPNYSN